VQRVLAIDTSTRWAGVALVERRGPSSAIELVGEYGRRVPDSHASGLIGLIERALADCGWTSRSLDAFVATRGPGSFTGIRIGLGTVQGLALSTGRPGLGVSTLEALVEAYGPAEAERVAVIGAGRGELYAARYDRDSSPPEQRQAPGLVTPEALAPPGRPAAVLVLAASTDPALLGREALGADVRWIHAPANVAGAAARLALLRELSTTDPSCALAPLYVRPPDAELSSR